MGKHWLIAIAGMVWGALCLLAAYVGNATDVFIVALSAACSTGLMVFVSHRLEANLRARNVQLEHNLTILNLGEKLAGMGRWRYDLRSGEQDWSPLMLELNGLPRSLAPDPGDVTNLLPDGGDALFGQVASNRSNREPFTFEYRIKPPNDVERFLRISVRNQFDAKGERVALFAVAMDVTDQVRREEALEMARGRAMRLAAEAQRMANTDPLTSIPNRRRTLARLQEMIDMAEVNGDALSLVMFDIDHFKRINDNFGHQTGDDVLSRIGEIASAHVRSDDLVGRIGGEEFVWLIPAIEREEASLLGERLRASIEKGAADENLPRVTASVGVAQWSGDESASAFLARADEALYRAKEGGRNIVCLAA